MAVQEHPSQLGHRIPALGNRGYFLIEKFLYSDPTEILAIPATVLWVPDSSSEHFLWFYVKDRYLSSICLEIFVYIKSY
jgi:hypothetical protein